MRILQSIQIFSSKASLLHLADMQEISFALQSIAFYENLLSDCKILNRFYYMQIGTIGINHKSAPLKVREEVSRYLIKRFGSNIYVHLFPVVLLSTCLRCELYFSGKDLMDIHHRLLLLLRNEIPGGSHTLYSYFGADCFFHLAKVTSGFDSLEFGESEIQGQVKRCYLEASHKQPLSPELHFLFQKSLKIGKEYRQKFSHLSTHTLFSGIWRKASEHFSNLHQKKLLFIGTSEINLKIARLFQSMDVRDLTFLNRTDKKADFWSKELNTKMLPYALRDSLFAYDLLFFATKSGEYLLTKELTPNSDEKKVLFDLSFPRNVDPLVQSNHLVLLNIEELMENPSEAENLSEQTSSLFLEIERQIKFFRTRHDLAFAGRESHHGYFPFPLQKG